MSTITYNFNVYAEDDYDSGQDGEYEIDPDYDFSTKRKLLVKACRFRSQLRSLSFVVLEEERGSCDGADTNQLGDTSIPDRLNGTSTYSTFRLYV
jgi:hypothetical protein